MPTLLLYSLLNATVLPMASGGPSGGQGSSVDLIFKNPARLNDSFEMQCPLDASIGQLKQRLEQEYAGNPSEDAITVGSSQINVLQDHYLVSE